MTNYNKCASPFVAAALALALTMGAGGPALAKDVTVVSSPPEDTLSERVSYADLDLASAAGVKGLTSRVRAAVRHVCAPVDQRITYVQFNECRSFAWGGARPQMDRAIERATQLASTGTTSIAPVAILIAAPQR
jgi:UrcA family protein